MYQLQGLEVADINSDGKKDVIVAGRWCCALLPGFQGNFLGNADGTFGAYNNDLAISTATPWITAGDLNSDGLIDFVFAKGIRMNLGNGTLGSVVAVPPLGARYIGDVSGDGKNDLCDNAGCFVGNGAGSFSSAKYFWPGPSGGAYVYGDFNGDGLPDMASTSTFAGAPILVINLQQ
jgi:hypothetical protein